MSRQEDQNVKSVATGRPTRRAKIMRGIVAPIFALMAVTCIVFGIINATVWKPNPQVSAQTTLHSRYIVTDPGVLELVDDDATVTASLLGDSTDKQHDNEVCIAIGSSQDAVGWISGHQYQRIKGLATWSQLQTENQQVTGKPAAESNKHVDFRQSDMWQKVKCSSRTVSMRTGSHEAGQVAIISVEPSKRNSNQRQSSNSSSQPEVKVQMHWQRHKLPNFAMPLYFAGGLLAVLAVLSASVFAMEPSKLRKKKTEKLEEQQQLSVAQAFGRTFASVLSRSKSQTDGHRRHGTQTAVAEESQPKVVDISAKNMLEDQQPPQSQSSEQVASDDPTGANSGSLQDYLQRFASEIGGSSRTAKRKGKKSVDDVNDDTSNASIPDDTNQPDIDDSTVGAIPQHYEDDDGSIDDRTYFASNEGISDETTEVFKARERTGRHQYIPQTQGQDGVE